LELALCDIPASPDATPDVSLTAATSISLTLSATRI